jgi:murein DD-endopeptidase MepM/ murein hydrolase activator NlpD
MNRPSKPDIVDRRLRILIIASALILFVEGALILATAAPKSPLEKISRLGEWRAGSPSPEPGDTARLAKLREALTLASIRGMEPGEAADAARAWAREIFRERPITDKDAAEILPGAAFFLARTSSKSDVDDIEASAEGESSFARAYKPIAEALPDAFETGTREDAVLDAVYAFRTSVSDSDPDSPIETLVAPVSPGERWIASEEDLKRTHQNALDIFFRHKGWGASEKGPVIRSMGAGIVVAAASDWVGGPDDRKYRGGGLTPRSGNGVIVYDPVSRRYFTYFHLHDVSAHPGQLVFPGTPLGHGGNTGLNARKRGHGGHLHLEIWDAQSNKPLSCYELRNLILSL